MFVGVLAFALSFVPMVGSLGYFGALALSPLFSWLGIFVGVDAGHDRLLEADGGRQDGRRIWLATRELLALWALAVSVLTVGALWNPNCDLSAGLAFFAVGPLVSGWLGVVCGLLGSHLAKAHDETVDPSRLRGAVIASIPFWVCLTVGLWRLYFDPVVFAFDPFWGHFAGPIYDEAVALGSRDLHFRAYNLSVACIGVVAWFFVRHDPRGSYIVRAWKFRGPLALALVASLIAAWYGLRPTAHGFHQTRASIEEVLRGTEETEHFVIHYVPRTLTAIEIEDIALEHEHAWRQLQEKIGRAPADKVHSFIFDNENQKRALFGAGGVEVSMPYRGHIYLTYRPFPHNVLHHELAHTFAGEFGDPLLGLSRRGLFLNVGLIEGVANALAPRPADELGLHDQAAILDALDKRPPLTAIMGLGFWGQSASRAYTAAGSFCLWLLETRGAEKLMALYQNAGDFEAVYEQPLVDLESAWVEFLRTSPPSDEAIEKQRLRFERRSVFRRPCAHRAAELSRAAERARRAGDDAEAIEKLRELCSIESSEPRHVLALAAALAADERVPEALIELEALDASDALTDTDRARIEELEGDVALVASAWPTAVRAYTAALSHPLRESHMRAVQIKLRAAELGAQGDLVSARLIRRYFAPFDVITPPLTARLRAAAAAVELSRQPGQAALGHYLSARQYTNAGLVPEARLHIERSFELDAGEAALWSPELRRAQNYLRVELRLREGDYAQARAALAPLANEAQGQGGYELRVEQWRARIDDYEAMAREPD